MNLRPTFSIVFALLISFVVSVKGQDKDTHIGTWKLVSTKYGEAKEHTPYAASSSRLKIINPTHFIWIEVESNSKNVVASAGGKYTMAGNTYTESIDFSSTEMTEYRGKPQKFTIRIDKDKLYQSGDLSDGLHIEEIWERVK